MCEFYICDTKLYLLCVVIFYYIIFKEENEIFHFKLRLMWDLKAKALFHLVEFVLSNERIASNEGRMIMVNVTRR